jgi:tetratricopeptide (TPR) repeat protein
VTHDLKEQIEQLRTPQFQQTLRELQKSSIGAFGMTPILWNISPEELERQAGTAVPALMELLVDPAPETRSGAAQALGRFGPVAAAAIPMLQACLRQEEEIVRSAALGALTQIDREGASWADRIDAWLNDPSPVMRLEAVKARWLLNKDIDVVLPVVEGLLEDADPRPRGQAASFVYNLITGDDDHMRQLLARVGSTKVEQRGQLFKGWAERKPDARLVERLLPAILRGVVSEDYQVRLQMARLLARIGPLGRPAIPALLDALRHRDQCRYPWFAARTGRSHTWSQLVETQLGTALAAVAANLSELPPELPSALDDPDALVRGLAAVALGQAGQAARPAVARLERLLEDSDRLVRVQAAGALWRLQQRTDVVATLTEALQQSGEPAQAAVKLLVEMGPSAAGAFPSLLHTVATQSGAVRPEAALALFKMGYETDAVMPVLQQGVASDDVSERIAAVMALHTVDPGKKNELHREKAPAEHVVLDVPDEEAVAVWTAAIEADADDAQAYLLRGLVHVRKIDLAGARADLVAAIHKSPQWAYAHIRRGGLNRKMKTLDEAMADYSEAIRLDAGSAAAYLGRGMCLSQQGKLPEAVADFDAALKVDPVNLEAFNQRAIARKKQGDLDGALSDYSAALKLDPTNPRLHVNRSITQLRKGHYADALRDAEMGRRLDPRNPDYTGQVAWILTVANDDTIRDPARGLELARMACEQTNWSKPGLLDTFACACAANGNFAEALRWIDRAISLEDSAPEQTRKEIRAHQEKFQKGEAVRK